MFTFHYLHTFENSRNRIATRLYSQLSKMAPGQKMYPRATVKKIVKAHSKCAVSKNADVMVRLTLSPNSRLQRALTGGLLHRRCSSTTCYSCKRMFSDPEFSYEMFCIYELEIDDVNDRLMKEAAIDAKQAGERGISARSVKKATAVGFFFFSNVPLTINSLLGS